MRLLRGTLRALLLCLVLVVAAAAAGAAVSQTAAFRHWLGGIIVVKSGELLNGELTIGRLDGNLFQAIELRDVVIKLDGERLIAVRDVSVRYNVWQLVTGGLSIDEIRLSSPELVLREEDGGWTIGGLIKREQEEADRQGPGRPVAIDRLVITDATVILDTEETDGVTLPARIDALNLTASFAYEPVRYSLAVDSLSFRTSTPELKVSALSGKVAAHDDAMYLQDVSLHTEDSVISVDGAVRDYLSAAVLDLRIASPQLSIPEIARFVPSLHGIALRPSLTLKLDGPLDALKVDASAESTAGSLAATVRADVASPGQSVAGHFSVRHLDLAPLLKDLRQKSDITGDARVDLSGETLAIDALNGTLQANARVSIAGYTADRLDVAGTFAHGHATIDTQVFAYGSRATASGHITLPDESDDVVPFDLRGKVERLNLGALPRSLNAPRVPTDINTSYHAIGSQPLGGGRRSQGRRLDADLVFGPSTVPGLAIDGGSTAHVGVRGAEVDYRADARLEHVDLQQIGDAFDIGSLRDPRYQTTIDGHVVASGRGISVQTLQADVTGTISRGLVMGGELSDLQFHANMDADAAHIDARGSFSGFDPALVSGKSEARGQMAGDLEMDAIIADPWSGLMLDRASGRARVSLDASTVGALAIDRAALDASYNARVLTIGALDVVGRDANLEASGTLNLGDQGNSDLTFSVNSTRLGEVARIFEVPLAGIGRADGRITGNRTELVATGTFEGDGIQYEETGALTLRSGFTIRVPDLMFSGAHGDIDARATFVTVAGQDINELTAKATYEDQRVAFDMSARQPQRQLDAAGVITIHPDHQEIHLDRLVLAAADQRWQAADGTTTTIHYDKGTIGVEGLQLTSGDQQITAEGWLGSPGRTLDVKVSNVDLAAVDALLLRPPQFSGRIDASGTVAGTREAPDVDAEFKVTSGGFRKFQYETLAGRVGSTKEGVTLDTRLQQNATQWIVAKGFLPWTLLAGASDEHPASDAHVTPSDDDHQLDLTIDSSPLGLGLIQGFTTALADVDGTVEAHVRVTGAAEDPHFKGTLTVADGRLTVPATGVSYTNIAGRVDLEPDRVHIDQITVLDNHQSALSVTGDVAIHAREVGGVQLWINAEDFKVLDNRMGTVRLQSAIEIAGVLRSPTIQGDLGVSTGRVDLDELLAAIGPSAYSTRQAQYLSTPAATAPEEPSPPSLFDALRMNLRLTVPDDLVVKAAHLQTPGASVALGALNVTLGGDLTALKEPQGPIRLLGVVNTVRGTYDFQGRRFEILRDGTVRFDGGETLSPVLDIRTRREIQGVEALVSIRGTIDRPQIELRSTPPLEDADILSLIVFNQPINQLGEGQQTSLAARAQSLAASAVVGQLAHSIGSALNLDTFEIEVAPESGTTAELSLGQQVGRDLYVKVQQGIGDFSSTNLVVWNMRSNGGCVSRPMCFRAPHSSRSSVVIRAAAQT